MSAIHSKSAFVYEQVRRALQSGRYLPGQRIDPGKLAGEFNTSATPVRFALYRLVGEGLVADHARYGLQVPLLTEVALRDLYDWMERLLSMACDIGMAPVPRIIVAPESTTTQDDVVKQTWKLFDDRARHLPLVTTPCCQTGQRPAGANTPCQTGHARRGRRRAGGARASLATTRLGGVAVGLAGLSRTTQTGCATHCRCVERA